jgi:hypothetical protein
MKAFTILLVFGALLAVAYRYIPHSKPQKQGMIFKPEKLKVVKPKAPNKEAAYDTAYAQYLRKGTFKQVLKKKDWIRRVEMAIAEQDRLILHFHSEIIERRKLLNRQLSQLNR